MLATVMRSKTRHRGVSLVELMVAMTLGLLVSSLALEHVGQQLADQSRLAEAVRLEQDLRAAADLLTKELQRANAWESPERGVWDATTNPSPINNPYISLQLTPGGRGLSFARSSHDNRQRPKAPESAENQRIDADEWQGVAWRRNELLQRLNGGNFQPLNDTALMRVTAFELRLQGNDIDAPELCAPGAAASAAAPGVSRRVLDLRLQVQSPKWPELSRELQWQVPLRTPVLRTACA
ncbi:PilW family protein [Roseateles sp. BYS180W]|uniref:PilW family protein n=1 Tax=Roseateles rivi TaxID=3299028 RepID=A0ABW7FXU8_9BURK